MKVVINGKKISCVKSIRKAYTQQGYLCYQFVVKLIEFNRACS